MPRLLPDFAYIKWFNSHNDPKHWKSSGITLDWENRVTCTSHRLAVEGPGFSSVHQWRTVLLTYDLAQVLSFMNHVQSHQDGEMRDRLGGPCGQPKDMGVQQSRRGSHGDRSVQAQEQTWAWLHSPSPLKSLSRASFSSLILALRKGRVEKSDDQQEDAITLWQEILLAMHRDPGEYSQRTKYNPSCNYLIPTNK